MPEISQSRWHKPGRQKICISCKASKALSQFYAYGYTTNQGRRSTRYESRCKPCARKRRRVQHRSNREQSLQASKDWRKKNPGAAAASSRAYRNTEHGRAVKAKLQRLRKARQRVGAQGPEDNQAIRNIYAEAKDVERIVKNCPVFDLPELGKQIQVDHIIPLAKGGRHVAKNLQLLPIGLNMRKGVSCPR